MNFKRLASHRSLQGSQNMRTGRAAVGRSATRERLAREFFWLETLSCESARGVNSAIGKLAEQRIVDRELIDLELQEFDEQIERICEAAA